MRQIFSVRFFAAVGAVFGLFFLLTTIFATRDAIEGGGSDEPPIDLRKIDLVEQVFSSRNIDFSLTSQGLAANDTNLVIDGARSLRIVSGTPGANHCPRFPEIGECAVLADLIGEAVVWFALVPMGVNRTVGLPAIDTLDDGLANLVNGWQVPYASVLDRRCEGRNGGEEVFDSYREFRAVFVDNFTSIFSLDQRKLSAVECRTRVAYVVAPDEPSFR